MLKTDQNVTYRFGKTGGLPAGGDMGAFIKGTSFESRLIWNYRKKKSPLYNLDSILISKLIIIDIP